MVVAFGIFLLCSGFALRTIYLNRRAADTTLRVGHLQGVRTLLDRLARDLRAAVAVESPGWGAASPEVRYRDARYHHVAFFPVDAAGRRLGADDLEGLAEDAEVHLMREETAPGIPPRREQIDDDVRLRRVRFFRLGRNLLGLRIELRGNPDASTVALRRGESYSTVVALTRQVL